MMRENKLEKFFLRARKARADAILLRCQTRPLKEAIDDYEVPLREEKDVRVRTAAVTTSRLRRFFADYIERPEWARYAMETYPQRRIEFR
jgi:hypothetical protein